jgi:hypothetical protein
MDEELKKYLEQNRLDMIEMRKMVKGIKNHFIRAEIYQWLVIVLIVAPFAVGLIWLWPSIKTMSGQFEQILSNGVGAITGSDTELLK